MKLGKRENIDLRLLNRVSPALVWDIYSRRCRKAGMKSSALILSFDCDTDDDIAVAWDVHSRLMDMGILPAYAVPGAQLERGADVYRRIAATGAEFLNHGGRAHTYFDTELQCHRSCFFYEQQTQKDIEEDIRLGHEIVTRVIGKIPTGWRTPHFGSYQQPEHFEFLYSLLDKLNYEYSSSAMPVQALREGPRAHKKGLYEIPLTGPYNYPFVNMDSWSYFLETDEQRKDGFTFNCQRLAKFSAKKPILINIYADPCHIAGNNRFFEGIALMVKTAQPTTFQRFLQDTK